MIREDKDNDTDTDVKVTNMYLKVVSWENIKEKDIEKKKGSRTEPLKKSEEDGTERKVKSQGSRESTEIQFQK